MQDNVQPTNAWERQILEKALLASVQEQRRARRWGIFFKLIFLALILLIVVGSCSDQLTGKPLTAHTAIITVDGVIDSEFNNARMINESLRAAFEEKQAQGIILELNSPGGSPVQAGEVYDEITRLRGLYPEKKIYAVIGDVCASGCYYIAAATHDIYANQASLVGSIGVLFDSFGFVETLNKIGAERRLYISGQYKGFMDPFSPVQPEVHAFMQTMLDDVHQQFISVVEKGRGDRLKKNDLMFSGLAWTGNQSLDLGLIDGIGNTDHVARDIIGAKTLVDYTIKPSVFEQFSHRMSAQIVHQLKSESYGHLQM